MSIFLNHTTNEIFTSDGSPLLINGVVPGDVGTGGGVTDHGELTGLANDDHTQYFNQTRGDARYSLLGHSHNDLYYTETEIDNLLSAKANDSTLTSHTGDATIHFTKASINLNDLGDVSVASPNTGEVLVHNAGSWVSQNRIPAAVQLTDAANIAIDASLSWNFYVTLGGNRTLDAPTNGFRGAEVTIEVIQDATGSRTLTVGSGINFGTDITDFSLSTTAGAKDYIKLRHNGTDWDVIAKARGY